MLPLDEIKSGTVDRFYSFLLQLTVFGEKNTAPPKIYG